MSQISDLRPGDSCPAGRLQAAAATLAISPKPGVENGSKTGEVATQIFSPLKTTMLLLADDRTSLCFIATACFSDYYPFTNTVRQRVGAILGLAREQIAVFSSHNHSGALLTRLDQFTGSLEEEVVLRDDQLTDYGLELVRELEREARQLKAKLVPVTVAWALGHERRISYNRKGRRADGSTYLMREEDRVLLGEDFNGDIDDEAPVVAFRDSDGKPVCFLVQFTAHPVTAYHPQSPVVHGDYSQVAGDDLSAAHGGVPVLFLQGCGGDMSSKYFLLQAPPEERVANAVRLGHLLGETYIAASHSLRPSERPGLGVAWERVTLPFAGVPSERQLRAELAVVEDFLRRVAAGDEKLLDCLGIHTARSISPTYRMRLVEPFQRWLHWALRFHTENRLSEAPKGTPFVVGAFRIGDIGLVGMPCEPLVGIGRQIRAGSQLPLTIPVGYMNDEAVAYVPDGANLGDTDYQSAYYRYTLSCLPYRKPGGDLLARAGLRLLRQLGRRG